MPQRRVFISYSHRDEVWKDRLLVHLGGLQKAGLLESWDDRRISAGGDWLRQIRQAMDEAAVAVMLISPDYLNSPFILGEEVPRLLERRRAEGIHVVPVLVRSCVWKRIGWLSPIQLRPRGAKPLAGFRGNQRDSELAGIAEEILQLLESPEKASLAVLTEVPPAPPPSVGGRLPGESMAALHQLPTPPGDFTGREEELAKLRAAVERGDSAGIFGVRGAGGIGKTALALKLAAELAPSYPDGQIYLDLQGAAPAIQEGPARLTPVQAMAHVVRSFHPEARVPDQEVELAALYRSVLHGRRVLLLMDNAADRDQVEPLIPPAGCALLVTSRLLFHLPDLFPVDLDELPLPDARDLLRKQAPRLTEAEADEIARLCGRLPLALRLAGSALAERPNLSPAAYAHKLEIAKDRFEKVDAALEVSCGLLTEDLRQLWYRLAVFPATFDDAAAAAVWSREPDPAGEYLGALVAASLVEWDDGRYRLHDLARLFAANRLDAGERYEAEHRHAVYFKDVLSRADALYEAGSEDLLRGLRLFDREWANIQVGQAWAATWSNEDSEATGLCSAYPRLGRYCIALRLRPHEQIRWREAALAAARRLGDRSAEGVHLGNMGIAHAALGDPRRAIEYYEQRLAIARETGNRRGEGRTLGNLGLAYAALGDPRRAIEYYEQHLAIARELGDRRGESNASWNLGLACEKEGDFKRAVTLMQACVDFERAIGHPDAEKDAAHVKAIRAELKKRQREKPVAS